MSRKKLLKYTNVMLLERLKRLARLEMILTNRKEIEENEVDLNNTQGMIEDKMMGIKLK